MTYNVFGETLNLAQLINHVCFILFLSLYIVLIDVLIYSAAQLQECLINLLTYLLTYYCYQVGLCFGQNVLLVLLILFLGMACILEV